MLYRGKTLAGEVGWDPRKIWFTPNFDQICPEYKSCFSEKWTKEILALNLQSTSTMQILHFVF